MTTGLGIPSPPSHVGSPRAVARDDIADEGLSAFLRVRPRLFGIAYRMLGSAGEADDIVQDVWVRWQVADLSLVRDACARELQGESFSADSCETEPRSTVSLVPVAAVA